MRWLAASHGERGVASFDDTPHQNVSLTSSPPKGRDFAADFYITLIHQRFSGKLAGTDSGRWNKHISCGLTRNRAESHVFTRGSERTDRQKSQGLGFLGRIVQ